MENDKNKRNENNVQLLKKIYRVLSTVQFARETTKDKKFAHLSPHCVLHIYSSIVLSAFVVAENLFHLNRTRARDTERVLNL